MGVIKIFKNLYLKIFVILLSYLLIFYFGYYTYGWGVDNNNKLFPLTKFIKRNFFDGDYKKITNYNLKIFNNVSSKNKVSCPKPEEAYVIIGFGQSNSANSAGHRFQNKKKIINFFEGNCYFATDPMLGATGKGGSLWLSLSQKLNINNQRIVLATFGVGGSNVGNWLDKKELFPFYKKNIEELKKKFPKVSAVIWIQGEADINTNQYAFEENLTIWLKTISTDLPEATIYVTGTSFCGGKKNDKIVKIQEKVSNLLNIVYVGNTDNLNNSYHRYDGCHYSERGINELADMISKSWVN